MVSGKDAFAPGGEEREGSTAGCPLLPPCCLWRGRWSPPRASRAAKGASCPCVFSLSLQPTHELGLPALQFQDAEHRIPEPASEHIHCGFRHSHLRLYPQFALLLLLDQVREFSPTYFSNCPGSDGAQHRSLHPKARMVSPCLAKLM